MAQTCKSVGKVQQQNDSWHNPVDFMFLHSRSVPQSDNFLIKPFSFNTFAALRKEINPASALLWVHSCWVVYCVIKGETVRSISNVQPTPIFVFWTREQLQRSPECHFKDLLVSLRFPLFLSCLAILWQSVCFNLQPCNLLPCTLSPLLTPGSLRLMKDFFVVDSEDDTKSKIHQSRVMFLEFKFCSQKKDLSRFEAYR